MLFDKARFQKLDRLFNRFLEYFSYQFCSCKSPWLWGMDETGRPYRVVGCCRTRGPGGKPRHHLQEEGYVHPFHAHHSGFFHRLLAQGPLVHAKDMKLWLGDLEHGLVHGLCTAFVLLWVKYPEGIPDEAFLSLHTRKHKEAPSLVKQLLAALFHDFHRAVNGEAEGHDANVRSAFPALWPTAYTHSKAAPGVEDALIWADRIELRRFHDWQDWVKPAYTVNARKRLPGELVSYFYNYMRPAISYLLQYRTAIWFRHGPERKAYGGAHKFSQAVWTPDTPYPAKFVSIPAANTYSVETGRPPWEDCFWHGRGFQPWGFVPRPVARQFATARPVFSKDHLGLDGRIPLKHWVFLFARQQHRYEQPESTVGGLEPQLICHGVGHMELLTVQRMFAVVNRLLELFCALRLEEEDAL